MPIFITHSQNKAVPAKLNVAICLEVIIEKNGSKITAMRDLDKFLLALSNLLMDSAVEVRTIAKRAFGVMMRSVLSRSEIDRILQRVLNEGNYKKV